ncbi:MAG: hypothetical protein M1839_009528 [Geoglossum umbratile]|nr:MAG: hypothetical protein M1839_009528 [Geoglossum umbratile]
MLAAPDCTSGKEAYTIVSLGAKDRDGADIQGQIAIVTLCPAYLQKIGAAKVTSLGGLKGRLGKSIAAPGKALLKVAGRKHIDTLFVLTHTILHELMHTNFMGLQNVGHGVIDGSVGGSNSWSDLRNMATKSAPATQNNADSWAYLGLGAQIIAQGSVITEAGCIKKAGSPSTDQDEDCNNEDG